MSIDPSSSPLSSVLRIVSLAEPLGVRTTSLGARLVGHIPHVAPEAYLHTVFAPLDEQGIAALEAEIGRRLPTAYRDLLRAANGFMLFAGSLSVYGRRTSYVRTGDAARQPFNAVPPNTVERPHGLPNDAVVVGGYRADGSLVYVREAGDVVRCSRESATALNEWPDLGSMLTRETERLATYFDEYGRSGSNHAGSAPPPPTGV